GEAEDVFPVSPTQAGLLRSPTGNEELYDYNCSIALSAENGAADRPRLVAALEDTVDRLQSGRALMIDGVGKGDSFEQVILRAHEPRMEVISCADSEVDAILARPGDVSPKQGRPPHRLTVLKTSSGKVIVKMDINHAIMDGSSL